MIPTLHSINRRRILYTIAAVLGFCTWHVLAHREPTLKIVFLDVGQGDCAVIESPSGKVMLIDTGGIHSGEGMHGRSVVARDIAVENDVTGDDEGRRTVEPFLRSEGINHIDTIVLTHPHADHIGGAPTLIDDFSIDRLIDNGADDDTAELRKVLRRFIIKVSCISQRNLARF